MSKTKKLHVDFFEDLPYYLKYAKNKNPLRKILWDCFENDLGTSADIAKEHEDINDSIREMSVIYGKVMPYLIKMDKTMRKVRKISPKY